MITSKQRSFLKKLAHELEPTVFLGKSGLTENIKKEMENGFESRELVKVKLQEGCSLSPKEVANQLAQELNAEFVQASAANSYFTGNQRIINRSFCPRSRYSHGKKPASYH